MTPAQYWRAYAKQNTMYERRGVIIFRRAIHRAIAPVLVSGNAEDFDARFIRDAYREFYEYVGMKHKAWEDRRWKQYKESRPALLFKEEDDRVTPAERRQVREEVGIFARFGLSFRNAAWLRRLRDMIYGLDVAARITQVSDTLRKRIRKILSEASQEEVRTRRVASRLKRELGGEISLARARLIARTETTYVTNEAAKQSAMETGLELVKIWVATLDDRTRDAHRSMHGKDPIDAHQKFLVGGIPMDKPGDPAGGASNVCNCRCVVSYLPKDDAEL